MAPNWDSGKWRQAELEMILCQQVVGVRAAGSVSVDKTELTSFD